MIFTIARKEFRCLFASPSTWWMLALLQFLFAWFYFDRIDDYLQIQAQLAQIDSAPGATIAIAAPLCGMLALMLMMLIPLFTMRLIAEERRQRTWVLLLTAPIRTRDIVLGKFFGLMGLLTLIISVCALMLATLAFGTQADVGLILTNLLGVLLLAAAYSALGLYFSALNRQPLIAAVSTLAVSFGLWLLEMGAGSPQLRALSPNAHFQNLNVGFISSTDLVYFLLFVGTLLWLTMHRLDLERRPAP